jgi:hypothetical protein
MSIEQFNLTRPALERAMMDWTRHNEGPIGFEYIGTILESGDVLEALDRVAVSMQLKQTSFNDNDACLIWTAYMNMQEYGTPGFPIMIGDTNVGQQGSSQQ